MNDATPAGPGPWTDLDRPPLRQAALAEALTAGPDPVWRAVTVVPSTGSTNADLAALARSGAAAGTVLAADAQTAGRGRLDRSWQVPPRAAIAVSVLLRPPVPAERWAWLPLLTGTAVAAALRRTAGVPAVLKWPNDVLVPADGLPGSDADRKVCGILAEVVHGAPDGPAVVVGVGLNVSQRQDELPVPTAASLRTAGAACTDRDTLLRSLLRELGDRYRTWCDAGGDPAASGLAAGYRELCSTVGRAVDVHLPGRDPLRGRCTGVDAEGRIEVDDGTGPRAFAAGDVVHLRPAAG